MVSSFFKHKGICPAVLFTLSNRSCRLEWPCNRCHFKTLMNVDRVT